MKSLCQHFLRHLGSGFGRRQARDGLAFRSAGSQVGRWVKVELAGLCVFLWSRRLIGVSGHPSKGAEASRGSAFAKCGLDR